MTPPMSAWAAAARETALTAVALFAAFVAGAAAQEGSVASDRAALEALYDATGGADWKNSTNWKTAAPLGEWHGVTTDADGRVTELVLLANGLAGRTPEALGRLAKLRDLDLGLNELTGRIPDALGDLVNLYGLYLGFNKLTGTIPPRLGDLSGLIWFDLRANRLTGPIPDELASLTNLRRLLLNRNALTGPIPPWLGDFTSLEELELQLNGFSGTIPETLGNLNNLEELLLGENWGLSGPLPDGLQRLRLRELSIWMTQACAPAAWRAWLETIEFLGPLCGAATESATVDVAVVYTPATRRAAGGTAAIETVIDLLIAETNESYAASGVRHRVALAARSEVAYDESHDIEVDLNRLEDPSDGHMDEVHALRDRHWADLVHLLVAGEDDGGVAGVAVRPGAWSAIYWNTGTGAFAHELGHNMGLSHDRYQVHHHEGTLIPQPGYGYVNQQAFEAGAPPSSRWRTMMSYDTQCDDAGFSCTKLLRFANPRQVWNGDALGVPFGSGASGVAGPADATAVLNATAPAVAEWRVERTNRPPVPVAGALPNRRLAPNGTVHMDVSHAFVDPDGDVLRHTASSAAPDVATAVATGARVTLTAVSPGTAAIRVTASDAGGLSATQEFMVTVTAPEPFTDDPILPGVTPVRAVHFTELRSRIDELRRGSELAEFPWTDPTLRAGVTPVRLVHLLELRSALAAAYEAAGRAAPSWTDTAPAAGATPMRAAHLMELRAAVLALE